jgi:hypothetical protein
MNESLAIGVLVYQRYITQSQPAGMIAALKASGHRVTLLNSHSSSYEAGNQSHLNKLDLIIARGRVLGLLYELGWVEGRTPLIDKRASVSSMRNQIELPVSRIGDKHAASCAIPGNANCLSCQVHDSCYTVVTNPLFRGKSNHIKGPVEMAAWQQSTVKADIQQYLPDNNCDLKLYGIGDQIWIVGKPSPVSLEVSPALV